MKVELHDSYCKLTREPGDPRISHESTVGYKMKLILNKEYRKVRCTNRHCGGFGNDHLVPYKFVRMYPFKHGLTSCRLGLIDRKAKIILWHERYAIENAAAAFNQGSVIFQRVPLKE